MGSPNPNRTPRKTPKENKIQYLAAVCGICGGVFEPRIAHYHFVSQEQVSGRIKKHHPGWQESDEACPPCVDTVMTPRRFFRLPFLARLASG